MKKAIFIFLTLGLALTMAFASPMRILAAEDGNTVLVMKGREQSVDHEIEIDVMVEENSGVSGMLLSLEYDTSVFTLTNLEYGTAFSSLSPIHTNTDTEQGYGIYPFMISKEHPGPISFRMDCLDLLAVQGTLKSLQPHSSKASASFMVQLSHSMEKP